MYLLPLLLKAAKVFPSVFTTDKKEGWDFCLKGYFWEDLYLPPPGRTGEHTQSQLCLTLRPMHAAMGMIIINS